MSTDPATALVNVGDLAKPATTLIEKISEAVGGIFKPHQIIRVARAEGEAEVIRAEAQIQVTDLHRRAFHRFLDEEAKKQANIEEVTRKALPGLKPNAQPENIENDWLVHFFEKSRLVSDDAMQQLWSRVLAGEANTHGTFSKRTVTFLSSLDKSDAALFTSLCTYCWMIGPITAVVFDHTNPIYDKRGIDFTALMHLESLGLLQFNALSSYSRIGLPKSFRIWYYGTPLMMTMPKDENNELAFGQVLLTKTGSELAPICGSQSDPAFFDYAREHPLWKQYLKDPVVAAPEPAQTTDPGT